MKRTLSLKRDALTDLDDDGLRAVAGGATQLGSCLDYLSCNILDCVKRYTLLTHALTTAIDTVDC